MQEQRKTAAVNIFLVLLLPLLVLDSLPFHQIDVSCIVQPLGIWQGTWKLFAPNINTANVQWEAEMLLVLSTRSNHSTSSTNVTSDDPILLSWKSPDWANASVSYKSRYFRWMKYYESLAQYPTLYLPLAEYIEKHQLPSLLAKNNTNSSSLYTLSRLRLYRWIDYPLQDPLVLWRAAGHSRVVVRRQWTPPARQRMRTFVNDNNEHHVR